MMVKFGQIEFIKNFIILSVVVISVFINGCATILTSSTDIVYFDSGPESARILIDGLKVGKTPATLTLKRPGLSDKKVLMQLEGYEDRRFALQKG
tara:strand:- start:51 stop:335 length:285 start_codon:yes stop_codon:yes gene_type:complete